MNDFDKEIFDVYLDKLHKEAERNQEARRYAEKVAKRERIYKEITKDIKFISKFVKKCQSRQTGEKTIFYDIDIDKLPKDNLWGEFIDLDRKYYKIRGRSKNLSIYESTQHLLFIKNSILLYTIPALKWAYENYLKDNFYGKEIEFEGEKCKAFQIDWFDEVYITADNEKIKTTFQKKIEEVEIYYRGLEIKYPKEYEPESWENAWIDYAERYDIHSYIFNCKDMLKHPEAYPRIKNPIEYVKEAEKILHKKII